MPSRRRQISITVGKLAAVSLKRGSTACARAANNSTAPDPDAPSAATGSVTASPLRRYTCSSVALSVSWLVTRMLTRGAPAVTVSTSAVTASARCSQLSSTSSARCGASCARSASAGCGSLASCTPMAWATAEGTRAPSASAASSTHQTPSGYSIAASVAIRLATACATRVLPIPPEPVIVTTGCSRSNAAIAAESSARPYNTGSREGKLVRVVDACVSSASSGAGTRLSTSGATGAAHVTARLNR